MTRRGRQKKREKRERERGREREGRPESALAAEVPECESDTRCVNSRDVETHCGCGRREGPPPLPPVDRLQLLRGRESYEGEKDMRERETKMTKNKKERERKSENENENENERENK